jgi:hypothetical protein
MFNKIALKLVTILMLGIVLVGPHTSAHASKSLDLSQVTYDDLGGGGSGTNECLDDPWFKGPYIGYSCDSLHY